MSSQAVRLFSVQQLESAERQRLHKEVNGRPLTVLSHNGTFFAFDAHCFHMGGPLGAAGDIEELGSYTVISCPWHRRKIDLTTGKQIDTDLTGQLCASHAIVQRVYQVNVDHEGWIWVDLSMGSEEGYIPSDAYNSCTSHSGGYGLGHHALESGCTPPLTPYAGVNRRPMSPSPIETADNLNTAQQIPFRAQKSAAMRNANARMAVLQKMQKVNAGQPSEPSRHTQQTLEGLYARHAASRA